MRLQVAVVPLVVISRGAHAAVVAAVPEAAVAAENWLTHLGRVTITDIVIATFTIALCIVSYFQLREFRRELALTRRPKLIVRRITIDNLEHEPGTTFTLPKIQFIVANTGDTPAKVIEVAAGWTDYRISASVAIDLEREVRIRTSDERPLVLQAGASVPQWLGIAEEDVLHLRFATDVENNGRKRVIFWGHIVYEDAIGTRRQTGFYRVYNYSERRFLRVSDETDYEYGD